METGERGFTLIEVMSSLAISGALLTAGITSAHSYLLSAQRTQAVTSLFEALQTARMHAITRHRFVSICAHAEQTSNTESAPCDLSENMEWRLGWKVLAHDGQESTLSKSANTLVDQPAFATPLRILARYSGSASALTFAPMGQLNQSASFTICDADNRVAGRRINVSRTGHITVEDADRCDL